MNIRYPRKALIRRLTASVLCLCWLASFVYCQTVCLMGADMGHFKNASPSKASPSCHGAAKTNTPPCHSNSESSDQEGGVHCCCSMDVISQTANQVDWVHSHDLLVSQVCLLLSIQHISSAEVKNVYLASQPWRDWALTPELRLGPAIHSLAPPAVS